MSPNAAAALYSFCGVFVAAAILMVSRWPEARRAIAVWAATVPIVFFIHDQMQVMLVCLVLFAALSSGLGTARAGFFVIAVPTIPSVFSDYIPLPGVNFLTTLTPFKVAIVSILVPVLFLKHEGTPRFKWRYIDVALVVYIAYIGLRELSQESVTVGLRALFDKSITLGVPYFIVTRCIRSIEDAQALIRCLLIVSIMLASIEIFAIAKQWDFYMYVRPINVFTMPDLRAGFVRMELTANTHSLGFQLVIGLLCLELIRIETKLLTFWKMGVRILFFVGIYFTGSRGAILALVAGFISFWAFSLQNPAIRKAIVASAFAAILIGGWWLAFFAPAEIDPYGGVGYRQQLLTAGFEHIEEFPLFGDTAFIKSKIFEHLVQGQGIIDITNMYLQISLPYGLIGLVLFMTLFAGPLIELIAATLPEQISPVRPNGRRSNSEAIVMRLVLFVFVVCVATIFVVPIFYTLGQEWNWAITAILISGILCFILAVDAGIGLSAGSQRSRMPQPTVGASLSVRSWKAFSASTIIAWLVLIATTSDIGLTLHLGLIIAAFGRSLSDSSFDWSGAQSTSNRAELIINHLQPWNLRRLGRDSATSRRLA